MTTTRQGQLAQPIELVHETVSAIARRSPESVAVRFDGHSLTYRALDQRANRLAARLQELGIGPDTRVAVCLERSLELAIAILGVLKAGGAYVPLDPAYPSERLDFVLNDSGATVIVTSAQYAFDRSDRRARVVRVDEPGAPTEVEAAPPSSVGPENLAYLIYTSGSTGYPKGVMVSHANLVYSTAARLAYYKTPVDRYLLVSSVAFDSSVAGLFWTLCSGGRIVWPAPGVERDATRLAATIETERVSHLLALPSLYRMVLQRPSAGSLSSLRTVIVAGESCPASLVLEHRRTLPGTAFFNEYGPTEATVWCTVHEIGDEPLGERVPIGKAIPGATIHIVRPDGELCADEEAGELCVGGPGVTQGYINKPDLTADRFVADTFSGTGSGRLYRTGDLVRRNAAGVLDFLGRLDHQVKIRGYRIELGEIESQLTRHPSVAEAAVIARADASGDARLIAYVLPRPGSAPSVTDLRAFLTERLPEFMLPASFLLLAELPRSANGKIDRAALPAVGSERPELQEAYVAPRDDVERWLAGIWQQELMLERIGIHDRFFELGGDSIRAARIAGLLQDRLGEFVFVVLMFETPTVATLARNIRERYRAAVAREFGGAREITETGAESGVDGVTIARVRQLLKFPERRRTRIFPRGSQAMFILSPPRSGTTLLAAMLAGHPRLFAALELNLLGFSSLGERKATYTGTMSLWREGAIRSLMEAEHLTADAAIAEMEEAEAADLPSRLFFDRIQKAVAPRMVLDRSPAYALDSTTLRRIEEEFEHPLYVHLSRHPQAAIRSFADNHMDQVYFPHRGFTSLQAGELVWGITHDNVLTFLEGVPEDRQVHVQYEALVANPERVLRQLCAGLGLEFHPELLEPYKNKDRKIFSGLHPESKSMGDPKFHALDRITSPQPDSPDGINLAHETLRTAARLGYDATPTTNDLPSVSASAPLEQAERTRAALSALLRRRQQARLVRSR